MTYGLPAGTSIPYGAQGFPRWVYDLADHFGLHASTYAFHQSDERPDIKAAPNPQGLNRGIDWSGDPPSMLAFARWLIDTRPPGVEMVIYQDPNTGERVGYPVWVDFGSDFANHRDHVHVRVSQPIPLPGGAVPTPHPDFNEYAVWSGNNQSRNGTKVDLFVLHTQEGAGNADSLARWLGGPVSASYHYTVSQDPRDNGVTVCDVVDTDLASWSVLSANNRSINLCFAGSSASWSRDQWMRQSKAIDAAAYLAAQDCRKYGIPLTVISPPYNQGRAGITDHAYVTRVLGDGTHTDVGPNFPWDFFSQRVQVWAAGGPKPVPPPSPAPAPAPKPPAPKPADALDDLRRLLAEALAKLDQILKPQ